MLVGSKLTLEDLKKEVLVLDDVYIMLIYKDDNSSVDNQHFSESVKLLITALVYFSLEHLLNC